MRRGVLVVSILGLVGAQPYVPAPPERAEAQVGFDIKVVDIHVPTFFPSGGQDLTGHVALQNSQGQALDATVDLDIGVWNDTAPNFMRIKKWENVPVKGCATTPCETRYRTFPWTGQANSATEPATTSLNGNYTVVVNVTCVSPTTIRCSTVYRNITFNEKPDLVAKEVRWVTERNYPINVNWNGNVIDCTRPDDSLIASRCTEAIHTWYEGQPVVTNATGAANPCDTADNNLTHCNLKIRATIINIGTHNASDPRRVGHPSSPTMKANVTVRFEITNGTGTTTPRLIGTTTEEVALEPFVAACGSCSVDVLSPKFSLTNLAGIYNITITIDPTTAALPSGEVNENVTGEGNNGGGTDILVRASNITASFVSITPTNPGIGETFTLRVIARNFGIGRTSASAAMPEGFNATDDKDDTGHNESRGFYSPAFVQGLEVPDWKQKKINVSAYFNSIAPANFIDSVLVNLSAGQQRGTSADATCCELEGTMREGTNQIVIFADAENATVESNENDNLDIVSIGVEDLIRPRILDTAHNLSGPRGDVRPNGWLNVSANVTDPSGFFANLSFFDATNPDVAVSVNPMTKHGPEFPDWYFANITDLRLASLQSGHTYEVKVVAADKSAARNTNATLLFNITVVPWPKTIDQLQVSACVEQVVILTNCDSTGGPVRHFWGGKNETINVSFRVAFNTTGWPNETNNTVGKYVVVLDPKGNPIGVETSRTGNFTANSSKNITCNPATGECTALGPDFEFHLILGNALGVKQNTGSFVNPRFDYPGRWQVAVVINDSVGAWNDTRNSNIKADKRLNFTLWDNVSAQIEAVSHKPGNLVGDVNGGTLVFLRVHSKDNVSVERVEANFSYKPAGVLRGFADFSVGADQPDGTVAPLVLDPFRPSGAVNGCDNESQPANPDGPRYGCQRGNWTRGIPTGYGRPFFNKSGRYEYTIRVIDANLSVNTTNGAFTLNDANRPQAFSSESGSCLGDNCTLLTGTRQSTQYEENSPVLLRAVFSDDTNVTSVTARVTGLNDAGQTIFDQTHTITGNVTLQCPAAPDANGRTECKGVFLHGPTRYPPGNYDVTFVAADAVGTTTIGGGSESGTRMFFRVEQNLRPQFSDFSPERDGFGKRESSLVASFVVRDFIDGIDKAASKLWILTSVNDATPTNRTDGNGLTVERAPGTECATNIDCWKVSFTLSALKKGDVVKSTVVATDKSTAAKGGPLSATALWNFTIDGDAPSTTLSCDFAYPSGCEADGTASANAKTRFSFGAEDSGPAGIDRITVFLSSDRIGTVAREFQAANGSFTLEDLPEVANLRPEFRAGDYTMVFSAVDNAGNAEVESIFRFTLDEAGPVINTPLRVATASGWSVTARVADESSGVKSARLLYRHGQFGSFAPVALRPVVTSTDFNGPWTGELPGARKGTIVQYYIEALDNLDNKGFIVEGGRLRTDNDPIQFPAENHRPDLVVLEPQDGAVVGERFTLRWQLSDIDGDDPTVKLRYGSVASLAAGKPAFSRSIDTSEQARKRIEFDARGLANGAWQFNLTADDGDVENHETTAAIRIQIERPVVNVSVESEDLGLYAPGEDVPIRVRVNRLATTVRAEVFLGDELVDSVDMSDDGRPPDEVASDLVFSGTTSLRTEGDYRVDLLVAYEDGKEERIRSVGRLTISRFADPFSSNLVEWGLAFALLAGIAVVVVIGRRKAG